MSSSRAALESLRPKLKERLPPLNALRAFEAAARKLNFTAAAKELFVTAGAVSLHVKQLEEYLDVQLFVREAKGLRLTPEGERYLPEVSEAFSRLRQATLGLRGRRLETVRLAVRPLLCHRWLLPRLPALMAAMPCCHFEIETELDRDPERQDLLLDYQPGVGAEVCSRELFSCEVVPVCSPGYLQSLGLEALDAGSDWSSLRLLHDRPLQGMTEYPSWARWLQASQLIVPELLGSASFANGMMCLESARLGGGLALAPRLLVQAELDAGLLVAPFAGPAPLRQSYFLLYRRAVLDRAPVRQLLDLLAA
ncbi:MAG: LysR family transcriptional regulator [Roseateles asaccharophilus]|uniref:LysR family transcriptional regulator n=1 Tax=Roseateles asaccharophilus TaxID=582607 RepID=A0A4R6MYP4_9BURK|nr:LysR family transcriptional regulator [Roseateles asaccharophilus]MDN3545393.1 LysR substrate-binding domain-containing protein [Roseateles asaccharophilus]TDP07773.1 LysR family transcriptional regulator [Roseateles asaccharophilus]